ncbi:hypothetical protein [Kineosporia sp. R_H_3]|uniref:hypothetical protein n=1 Tax=Kineosporia sp. R_H_3 TaxID=1961848 RepID=UPI000B4ABD59|nr:hypothetical protein [Kineosporia sp. R_H_3]
MRKFRLRRGRLGCGSVMLVPSDYPNDVDTFTVKTEGPDQTIRASHINDLQDAVVAVQTELGGNPSGSSPTVAARLAAIEAGGTGGGGGSGSVVTLDADGTLVVDGTTVEVATDAQLAAAVATLAPKAATWATGAAYVADQLVVNAGTLYRCTTAHTAGGSFAAGSFAAVTGSGGSTVTLDADGTLVVDGTTVEVATDAQLTAAISGLSGTYGPAVGSDAWLKLHAAGNLDALLVGAITRDANGAATTGGVVWPDGVTGTYTATTVSSTFPGLVDAYTVTWVGGTTKTVTQPAVTRDGTTGAVTNRPAMTVA